MRPNRTCTQSLTHMHTHTQASFTFTITSGVLYKHTNGERASLA